MFDTLVSFLTLHSQYFIYVAIFSILVLGGVGFPIPEEATLLGSGFLVYGGFSNLTITLTVCYCGVVLGDIILFYLSRRWGDDIINHRFRARYISEKRLDKARKFFEGHGSKTIFFARFITGFRIVTFATAGILKMKICRFITINTIAALISVPLVVFIGYMFGASIDTVIQVFQRTDTIIITSVLVVMGAFFTYRLLKRRNG